MPLRLRSGRWGALRSEVEEEVRPQAGPGDTNAVERPAGPIPQKPSYNSVGPKPASRSGPMDRNPA